MSDRRAFLGMATTAALLAACRGAASPRADEDEEDVGAVEDLMREHGVIRRVLVVYRESTRRSVNPGALAKAARLMRTFGEDYHERQLEEAFIFPVVAKTNGAAIDALLAHHRRGREITDYILAGKANADVLESFARMYEAHAAFEDTVVFPAWKKTLSAKQLDELGERFEDIEKKTFGKDGFDDAVTQIGVIEQELGIDLPGMLAPPP